MLGEERQQAILAAVEQRHSVSVQELMQLLDISESTIRRDLNALDKEGRLVKVHGGAMAIGGSFHVKDDAVEYRKEINREECQICGSIDQGSGCGVYGCRNDNRADD